LRCRAAVVPLSKLLSDASLRRSSAWALVEIGDERGLNPLRNAAHGERRPLRRRKLKNAVRSLEERVGLRTQ
jgi:HEAT repeat protein